MLDSDKNVVLIIQIESKTGVDNIDNILSLIERFGFMPNASNSDILNRSQPPYASMMVREVYEKTGDKEWLAKACKTLEKEYDFWMTKRITSSGLNHYSNNATNDYLMNFYN